MLRNTCNLLMYRLLYGFNLFLNMLTPIIKQGDEHIYILLEIGIINWISVRYVDILRLVWMLIGSEIVSLNYAASGKARFAQVLRNSPRAMQLLSYPSTRGCPTRHLMMPCQSLPDTRHRSRQLAGLRRLLRILLYLLAVMFSNQ